ncbi:MAG: hypothetical protein ACLQJR_01150 [Stellaceae bacterium]
MHRRPTLSHRREHRLLARCESHSEKSVTASSYSLPARTTGDFIDGPDALDPAQQLGQGSFDHLAGSILNMFDFEDAPNLTTLILDPTTGRK